MSEVIVGRSSELIAVEGALDRAPRALEVLSLEGDAGIGKTTIWRAAVDLARSRGWRTLTAKPARAEQALPLGGFGDLLGRLEEEALAGLPEPQRHALDVALLRVSATEAPPDQRALSVAAASLLRDLATADRPVLLAVDDAQWLDESSAAVLAYAIRRLGDRPVVVLLAIRSGIESQASDALLAASPNGPATRIAVGPMPLGSLHHLLESRLGRSFPRLVLVRIEAMSGGNPLFALEIARSLDEAQLATSAGGDLPIPESITTLLAGRVRSLPGPTRDALVLAAAAAEPTASTLARAGATTDDLEPAVGEDIVRREGSTIRFSHPLLAQAALSLASPEQRRAAHAALALASQSPDARAFHLGQAADAPDETAAAALERAAAAARDRGATMDAARLAVDAARLTPDSLADQRVRRLTLAAETIFVDLGEVSEADRILAGAVATASPGPARAEALSLRAVVRYYHGRVAEGIELGEQALGECGGDEPRLAKALGRVAYLVMQRDLRRGLDLIETAIQLLERSPTPADPDVLANALLLRAVGELAIIRPARPGAVERALNLMSPTVRTWERDGAAGSEFGLARHSDRLDRAIELARGFVQARSGPGGYDPFDAVQLSGLLVLGGEWTEARRLAESALETYLHEGSDVHPAWGLRGVALVAAHDGRLADARVWAEAGLRAAEARGDVVVALSHRHILGFIAVSLDEWQEAVGQLRRAWDMADSIQTRHPGRFKLAGDLVEAALAGGDPALAERVVERVDEAARVAPTPWVLAVGARCRAQLAASRGELDLARDLFELAMVEHGRLPMPFERGRTLLAKGMLHRRRREKRLADEALREALAAFEALGAAAWADRARIELRRVGLRPHASADLTETERRVADLAASGLSNRRIAEQAFLAPKTVGNVLGRVYEKLGIHTRAELGAVMATSRRPDGADESRPAPERATSSGRVMPPEHPAGAAPH